MDDLQLVTPEVKQQAFERICQRANKGNARAREVLKKRLDHHPELVSGVGSLARAAELEIIKVATCDEWFVGEAVKREMARMRRDLAGPNPTPLETMAVERVVATWLMLQYTEMRFLQAQKDLGWARYWLRRQEQADKLYRAAIGSLVLIRDMLPPAAPPSTPAIVDARVQAPKPEASNTADHPGGDHRG